MHTSRKLRISRQLKANSQQQKKELSRQSGEIVSFGKESNEVLRGPKSEKQENATFQSQVTAEPKINVTL
jgi:hypothetical protein